ncbi:MAG TPA: c-type cytochrome [Pseudolabrys sp.]
MHSPRATWQSAAVLLGVLIAGGISAVNEPANAATGNAAAGEKVFTRCAVCHSNQAGVNKVGPSLDGVVGRKSGTEPGYNYSPAMKSAGLTWDQATLDKFLQGPSSLVHGTKMFLSVPSETDRQNVIAYLETLK